MIQGPDGSKTTASYNALGHKVQMKDDNQGESLFVYNALGELRQQTDGNGTTLTFNYDKLGRITSRSSSKTGEATRNWTYDDTNARGTLSQESLGNGLFSKSYVYDDKTRLTQTTTVIDGTSYKQAQVYDSKFGRLLASRQPDGTAVYYQYNDNGYATNDADSQSAAAAPLRSIDSLDHNGLITQASYRNGLVSITDRTAGGAVNSICTNLTGSSCSTSNSLQYISYQNYDSFGNLGVRHNHSQAVKETISFDNLDRIKSVKQKKATALPNGPHHHLLRLWCQRQLNQKE